jgi:hypothetical protein
VTRALGRRISEPAGRPLPILQTLEGKSRRSATTSIACAVDASAADRDVPATEDDALAVLFRVVKNCAMDPRPEDAGGGLLVQLGGLNCASAYVTSIDDVTAPSNTFFERAETPATAENLVLSMTLNMTMPTVKCVTLNLLPTVAEAAHPCAASMLISCRVVSTCVRRSPTPDSAQFGQAPSRNKQNIMPPSEMATYYLGTTWKSRCRQ